MSTTNRERNDASRRAKESSTAALSSFEGVLGYLRWGLPLLLVGYLLSGVIVVGSDEVAVVLRFGELSGGNAAKAQRSPGLHYTLPRPIDEAILVKVKKVYELEITDLHSRGRQPSASRISRNTINPSQEGYVLTGDHNIIQVDMVARYLINDPVAFALHQADAEQVLRSSVMAATVRTMGEVEVDAVLSEGRGQFIVQVIQRAQARLDRAAAGINLVSIEVTDLAPPQQVQRDFEQVQNAFIDMETKVTEAKRVREREIPQAHAARDQELREAEAYSAVLLAQARGDAAMWLDLYDEYRQSPRVLRERLYLESVEVSLSSSGRLRFVPPPHNGRRYDPDAFRISIPAGG